MIKKILMFIVIYLGVDCVVSVVLGVTGLIGLLLNPIIAFSLCAVNAIIALRIMKSFNKATTK